MPPEAVRRTREIAERCGFAFEFNRLHFPAYVPADGSMARQHLRHLAMEGFRRHYGGARREVLAQLEEELGIIAEVGYEEYFLVVRDILVECRRRGIPWITRGSAGDSLVCRCLEISDFCPVRFELYFRRFLNRERMALNKLPDIDLDFPHDRKDDVVALILEKFGHEHAALVGGFGTFQARSAVAEILKVLGTAEGQVRRFTERFPWGRLADMPVLLKASQECTDLPVDEEPYSTALRLARFLDGFPRHPKQHPCGLVLSRVPIRSLTPTFTSASGLPTTHFDMDAVEAVGLVKMDILAQGGLAVMRDVCAALGAAQARGEGRGARGVGDRSLAEDGRVSWLVEEEMRTSEYRIQNSGGDVESRMGANGNAAPVAMRALRGPGLPEIEIRESKFENASISLSFPIPGEPWEDPTIWRMIAAGDSRGVHHIESPAMISLARMCGCRNIDQLVAIVSVIRPGAANSLKKEQFARRCQGLEPVEYAHPTLEEPLRSTYGVVAYEEHILQICEAFASLPPGRADVLRRALVKEKQETIAEIKGEFLSCARAIGRSEEEIAVVWALVEGFQGYAFCRAHSTAYALEAYQAAWLKLNHPAEFLAGVLTHGKGFYPRLVYTLEARRLGVGLLGPDINATHEGYAVEYREGRPFIRVPVPAVAGLCTRTLEAWRRGRPFASLDDFIQRVPAEFQEIQNLIRTGAFDGFGRKRSAQFWQASALAMEAGQGGGLGLELVTLPPAERLADTTRQERLDAEWELLGYTVGEHPLARWPDIDWSGYLPSVRLGDWLDRDVTVCGLIVDERLHNQVDGRLMKFVLIADHAGMIECELFADIYERFGAVVARNPVVALHGTVSPFDNRLGWTLRVKEALAPRRAGGLTSAQSPD
jgi:DNA polymerase III alpha subunit